MITELRKDMVDKFINQNYSSAIQNWCEQHEKELSNKTECKLQLDIDFHSLGDKDPALMGVFLNNYFNFMKLSEEIVERNILIMLNPDFGLKLPEVQRKVRLSFRLANFPKMKISSDIPGLIQSLIKKETGFLLCASGFVVMEAITEGSYSAKSFYRSDCECRNAEIRCNRSHLLQNIKESDDLSARPRSYTPRCKECNRIFEHLPCFEVYKRFKQLRVKNPSSSREEFMLFVEASDSANDWVKPGVTLEGVFYLDCVSKLKSNTGRFLGENHRILLAVEVRLQAESESIRNIDQSALIKARDMNNYFALDRTLVGEDFANHLFSNSIKNTTRLIQNLAVGSRFASSVLDLVGLLAIVWLKQNDDLVYGSNSLIKLLESNEMSHLSTESLLHTNVSGSKLNLLIYSEDPGLVIDRLRELSKGLVGIEVLPSDIDEPSCINWLIQNSNRMLVVTNYIILGAKIKAILSEAAEHQRVKCSDGTIAQLRCSMVVIEFSRGSCLKKIGSDLKAREFFDKFDIIINLNLSTSEDSSILPQILSKMEDLLTVYTSGCLASQIAPPPAKVVHPTNQNYNQGNFGESSSQTSRLSYLYNKMRQKVVVQAGAGLGGTSNTKRPFPQQSAEEQAAVEGKVAAKILLGYCSAVSESGKLSQKNIITLKKTALALGILRSIATSDSSTLIRIISNERAQNFQVEVFDALMSCILMENTRKWSNQAEHLRNPATGDSLSALTAQAMKLLSESALNKRTNAFDSNSRQFRRPDFPTLSQRSKVSTDSTIPSDNLSLETVLGRIRDFMFNCSNYYL